MPHCPAVSRAAPGSINAASLPELTEKQTGMDIGQIAASPVRAPIYPIAARPLRTDHGFSKHACFAR